MKKLLLISVAFILLQADYNKGFKYYQKYIKKPTKITLIKFINDLNITSEKNIDSLFENNAELLIKKLKENNQAKVIKGVKKIIKKHKLNDLKDFIKGIYEGKIPSGC